MKFLNLKQLMQLDENESSVYHEKVMEYLMAYDLETISGPDDERS